MQKKQNYHFANDLTEVGCKMICWFLSFSTIFVIWSGMNPKVFNSQFAEPTLIFGISCLADMFLIAKRKKGKASFFYRLASLIIFIIIIINVMVIRGLEKLPNFISIDLNTLPKIFFGIFAIIIFLMAIDFLVIQSDSEKQPETQDVKQYLEQFIQSLEGPKK